MTLIFGTNDGVWQVRDGRHERIALAGRYVSHVANSGSLRRSHNRIGESMVEIGCDPAAFLRVALQGFELDPQDSSLELVEPRNGTGQRAWVSAFRSVFA